MAPALGALLMLDEEEPGIEDFALLQAEHGAERDGERVEALSEVGEIYLELATVDLDDPDAIFSFVRDFGVLGVAYDRFRFFRDLPGFTRYELPRLAESWPRERYAQRIDDYLDLRGARVKSTLVETLDEFRFGARCLQDLLTAARTATTETTPSRSEWLSISSPAHEEWRLDLLESDVTLEFSDEANDIFLRSLLTAGLAPFHPRLIYVNEQPGDIFENVPLYATCCLELFNHIAEHATYQRCANETCNRPFVRQRGRAEAGQHRSHGVRYCTSTCARSQAQRNYRRRLKQTP
jgi:hypothetical protein